MGFLFLILYPAAPPPPPPPPPPPFFHTPSFTHIFVNHQLWLVFVNHRLSHPHLCQPPSVTHIFVTHHLSGTWRHPPSFHVAGVALRALGWLWRRAWTGLVAGDAAALCVAGVALGDIRLSFTWQAWHLVTSTFVSRGTPGTWSHPPLCGRRGTYGTGLALVSHALFVTHHLSHTIFDTPSFRTLSHTIFVTQHLSHAIFHTPSFTPNFVTHHL